MPEPERDQTRPLATSTPTRVSSDAEEDAAVPMEIRQKRLRRRRCLLCGGCAAASLLVIAIVIIVLVFTVFRVRDPKIAMNYIEIERLESELNNLRPTLNMTLGASMSVKNPNYASFRFTNTTTIINYGGIDVGEARTPPGNARARRTIRMDVTIDIIPERIMAVQGLLRDLVAGVISVNSVTKVEGRVKIIGIKKHVDVRMDCVIALNITGRSIQSLDCDRHVSL